MIIKFQNAYNAPAEYDNLISPQPNRYQNHGENGSSHNGIAKKCNRTQISSVGGEHPIADIWLGALSPCFNIAARTLALTQV